MTCKIEPFSSDSRLDAACYHLVRSSVPAHFLDDPLSHAAWVTHGMSKLLDAASDQRFNDRALYTIDGKIILALDVPSVHNRN
jgi:hypothetical protein